MESFGLDICVFFLCFYVFIGCDLISGIYGIGKKKVWMIFSKNVFFYLGIVKLGDELLLLFDISKICEVFICLFYISIKMFENIVD